MANRLAKSDAYGDLYEYAQEYRGSRGNKRRKKKKSKKRRTFVAILLCLALAGGGLYAYTVYAKEQLRLEMVAAVEIPTFYPGTTVDNVDISHMTLQEAKALWQQKADDARSRFRMTITAEGHTLEINDEMAGLAFDAEALLEDAFQVGRSGELEQRYAMVGQLAEQGRHYTTHMTYDLRPVREQIIAFCEQFYTSPVNAKVQGFDYETKEFLIQPEQPGLAPDTLTLANTAIAMLERQDFGQTLELTYVSVSADINQDALAANLGLRAEFTTETTSNKDRNTNIKLASEAISGTILQPGEEFSFNDTTGERSPDKGYKEAGAIKNGVMIQEPGGGVCQVSSTLFNAVIRADLEITDRHPHSWPSTYVNIGEDAAVDYPYTDFKFRNNTDQTLYIRMRYRDRQLTAQIYGLKLEEGLKIVLESEHKGYIKPKSPTVTVNKSWREGKVVAEREERYGQNVLTYVQYYKNGELLEDRSRTYKTAYRSIQGIYEVGPNTKAPSNAPKQE